MCRRLLAAVLLAACFCGSAAAQDDGTVRFKWYGFIRNLFVADSRESVYGTADFFYYVPKDRNVVDGVDLNAQMNFCYSAITTRLGVDILGYEVSGRSVSGKIEGDLYAGVTGVTGTASLRLRQACMTLSRDAFSLKAGQSWHPMAADMPHIFSPNTGAPFGPFSRTPELVADWGKVSLGFEYELTGIQYGSFGPGDRFGLATQDLHWICNNRVLVMLRYIY